MRKLLFPAFLFGVMAALVWAAMNTPAAPETPARAQATPIAAPVVREVPQDFSVRGVQAVGKQAHRVFACVEAGGGDECFAGVF